MSTPTLDLIAIIDVETTGLVPTQHEVIELGCILFSLSHNTVLQQVSTLVPVSVDANPVECINGISAGAAMATGLKNSSLVLECIEEFMRDADVTAAHNASFDKSFWEATAIKRGWYQPQKWIDPSPSTGPALPTKGAI